MQYYDILSLRKYILYYVIKYSNANVLLASLIKLHIIIYYCFIVCIHKANIRLLLIAPGGLYYAG